MKRIAQTLSIAILCMGLLVGNAAAMNKAELVEAMATEARLSKADAKKALDGFIDATSDALGRGDRLSLIGFGSFSISKRSARTEACSSLSEVHFTPAAPFIYSEEEVVDYRADAPTCPDFRILRDEDLIHEISERSDLRQEQVAAAYNVLLDTIIETVNAGGEVCIDGFGDFYVETEVTLRAGDFCSVDTTPEENERGRARTGRNPQTGKEIKLETRGLDDNELRRLIQSATQVAAAGWNNPRSNKASSDEGRRPNNPKRGGAADPDDDGDGIDDCVEGVCVTAKNVVKFKAGADLSSSVN